MIEKLLQEIRELRTRVEKLEEYSYPKGKMKKKGVPESAKMMPPWEKEGLTKKEWKNKTD